jgi:hypothetical protein
MGGLLPKKEFEIHYFNPKSNLLYCVSEDCPRLASHLGKCERCHAIDWYHAQPKPPMKGRVNADLRY